ncbi:hypothetical protein E0H22_04805 [Rhodopseudomonas boonkerdii]|uniref:hypothetical protein n=1 Tax=Rhodopseudomonas boonkerdii TaxID=475937 RepID=UPI001E2CB3A9|nr:hypothetical protein [Rhodopseudomonas boonkerdii]UGV25055.1 hypothetical protein E0H22_04805 [Rhodopseudomonas boonkerdii]
MGTLSDQGIEDVRHYAPLHYLPFIARSNSLMRKPSLAAAGFPKTHYRSMSNGQDVVRGFGDYAHLTLDLEPRILKAKLAAGFPHIAISIPVAAVDAVDHSLCRFNVAMTRKLRRGNMPGHDESTRNGKYYEGHEIPIARTINEKTTMLSHPLNARTMIEVLIHDDLLLPTNTKIISYSDEDFKVTKNILTQLGSPWSVDLTHPPSNYPRSDLHSKSVADFIAQALADPSWRGNGLEFDKFK